MDLFGWFEQSDLVLAAIIGAVGTMGLLVVLRSLRRAAQRARRKLEDSKRFHAVSTEAPVPQPEATAKERALESVVERFTITRRALIPAALLLIGIVSSIPLLEQAPAAMVSVAAATLTLLAGIAARPYLENLFAGLVISYSRLINIGDTVMLEDEHYGTVEDITATHTTVKLWDWRRYVVPNSQLLQRDLVNYSLFDKFVWARVEFWVAHDADLAEVERLAVKAAKDSEFFGPHEDPRFWVISVELQAIRCWVAAWASSPQEAWSLRSDIATKLMAALRDAGIYPHRFHLGSSTDAAAQMGQTKTT